MTKDNSRITLLNGSLGAEHGNTAALARETSRQLESLGHDVTTIQLRTTPDQGRIRDALTASAGFVFMTGTYWDSWGSPLQTFLENTTDLEAGTIWLGKPAAVVVTMHSVGGKEVLSRLQGVLCTLGLQLPPMSGLVYSLANHAALRGVGSGVGLSADTGFESDLWSIDDLSTVTWNLSQSVRGRRDFRSWPVDGGDPHRLWLELP